MNYIQLEMNKTHTKPTKICIYADKCYRKNPIHFTEYAHKHLDDIYEQGKNRATKCYNIPDEYLNKDVIELQLKLLERLFPIDESSNCSESSSSESLALVNVNGISDLVSIPSVNPQSSRQSSSSNSEVNSRKRPSERPTNFDLTTVVNPCSAPKQPRVTRNIHDYIPVVAETGRMQQKLENAAPYNFFLTAITSSPVTHTDPLSVTFQEILDPSLGEIESTVQINFMVDIGWLLGHYYFAGCLERPVLVLYGQSTPVLDTISQFKKQVTAIHVRMPTAFSTHHSKMMLLAYTDGSMRVIVSTANLYEDDWNNRTQGIWISPKLKRLPDGADPDTGESPTEFRRDLMLYLVEYKLSQLQPWIARIRNSDFSAINVFFVASVPGTFRETSSRGFSWGHARLGYILSKHATPIEASSPVVAQSSSIGSLGPNFSSWIEHDIIKSLGKDMRQNSVRVLPLFKMIYPSVANVLNSHDGILGGGCLPYSHNVNQKQGWLKNYLHQWKCTTRNCNKAMPHIKTYCRWTNNHLHWFMLTSANLSKAAWGTFNKNLRTTQSLRIMNYEVGVLFLPQFIISADSFPLEEEVDGAPIFPMPYDIPLRAYNDDDEPFLIDLING